MEIDKGDIIAGTMVSSGLGFAVVTMLSLWGCWGSRGIVDEYSFRHYGNQASVQRDDRIWCPDRYWIKIGDSKIKNGSIITDDGKRIEIYPNRFTIKDEPKENKKDLSSLTNPESSE